MPVSKADGYASVKLVNAHTISQLPYWHNIRAISENHQS
jgi:hypothetical protein